MEKRPDGSRDRRSLPGTADWPRLPGAFQPVEGVSRGIPLPTPPPVPSAGRASQASTPPEEELLERIAAFRSAVADALYEISKDYQVLCNLTHADLTSCDEIMAELRGRLADNIHYQVLAKLDDVHALVAAHIGEGTSPR